MESHPSPKIPKPETQSPATQTALRKQVNSIDSTVNQTLENSTFLSGEIKGAFLSAIGNAESLAGGDACGDEFGFSPFSVNTLKKSASTAAASHLCQIFTNSTILS